MVGPLGWARKFIRKDQPNGVNWRGYIKIEKERGESSSAMERAHAGTSLKEDISSGIVKQGFFGGDENAVPSRTPLVLPVSLVESPVNGAGPPPKGGLPPFVASAVVHGRACS